MGTQTAAMSEYVSMPVYTVHTHLESKVQAMKMAKGAVRDSSDGKKMERVVWIMLAWRISQLIVSSETVRSYQEYS